MAYSLEEAFKSLHEVMEEEPKRQPNKKQLKEGLFRGVPDVEFIWHGENSDPEVEYKGHTFNYWSVEDALWNEFKDFMVERGEEIDETDDTKFNDYCKEHCANMLDDWLAADVDSQEFVKQESKKVEEAKKEEPKKDLKESVIEVNNGSNDAVKVETNCNEVKVATGNTEVNVSNEGNVSVTHAETEPAVTISKDEIQNDELHNLPEESGDIKVEPSGEIKVEPQESGEIIPESKEFKGKALKENAPNFQVQDGFELWEIDAQLNEYTLFENEKVEIPEKEVLDELHRVYQDEEAKNILEDKSELKEFILESINEDKLPSATDYTNCFANFNIEHKDGKFILTDIEADSDYVSMLIDDDYDNAQFELKKLSKDLKFFEIKVHGGYHAGMQTIVEPEIEDAIYERASDLEYIDLMDEKAAQEQAEKEVMAEVEKINKELLPQLKDYGWKHLRLDGMFSNGEAVYSEIKDESCNKEESKKVEEKKEEVCPKCHKNPCECKKDGDCECKESKQHFEYKKPDLKECKRKDKKEDKKLNEELKLICDLSDYEPWSGAKHTWAKIEQANKESELETYLEEIYPDGLTMTQLNDILWFDGDEVLEYLGLQAEEEEEENEVDESKKVEESKKDVKDELIKAEKEGKFEAPYVVSITFKDKEGNEKKDCETLDKVFEIINQDNIKGYSIFDKNGKQVNGLEESKEVKAEEKKVEESVKTEEKKPLKEAEEKELPKEIKIDFNDIPNDIWDEITDFVSDKINHQVGFVNQGFNLDVEIKDGKYSFVAKDIDWDDKEPLEESKKLKESEDIKLNSKENIEKAKEVVDKEEENKSDVEQIVDTNAEVLDDLKPSYVGNVLLQCPACKKIHYVEPDKLVKGNEVNDKGEAIYNVDEECPVCGAKVGFNVRGQVAALDAQTEQPTDKANDLESGDIKPIEKKSEEKKDNLEDPNLHFAESLDNVNEIQLNRVVRKFLHETYNNVKSYKTTNVTLKDDTLIVEGLITFNSGKTKTTTFTFNEHKVYRKGVKLLGENKMFGDDSKFALYGKISKKVLMTEGMKYNYKALKENKEMNIVGKVSLNERIDTRKQSTRKIKAKKAIEEKKADLKK